MSNDNMLRRIRFTLSGKVFHFRLWTTNRRERRWIAVINRRDWRGQDVLGYRLTDENGTIIFCGEDFAGSPLHADDSDDTVASVLGFLALRKGDTDQEYFADYTPDQMAFSEQHGEELTMIVREHSAEGRRERDEQEDSETNERQWLRHHGTEED